MFNLFILFYFKSYILNLISYKSGFSAKKSANQIQHFKCHFKHIFNPPLHLTAKTYTAPDSLMHDGSVVSTAVSKQGLYHVLLMFVWVFSGASGFLPQTKTMRKYL